MSYMGRGITQCASVCLRHLAHEMATNLRSQVDVFTVCDDDDDVNHYDISQVDVFTVCDDDDDVNHYDSSQVDVFTVCDDDDVNHYDSSNDGQLYCIVPLGVTIEAEAGNSLWSVLRSDQFDPLQSPLNVCKVCVCMSDMLQHA